jgi:hypothetical protein
MTFILGPEFFLARMATFLAHAADSCSRVVAERAEETIMTERDFPLIFIVIASVSGLLVWAAAAVGQLPAF